MNIQVLIVTYGKRSNLLIKTIESVVFENKVSRVVIVNNGSGDTDLIKEYIDKHSKKEKIDLINHKENKGSAGGYNAGITEIRKITSSHILFLDDDMIIQENWVNFFEQTLSYFEEKEKILLKANRHDNFFVSKFPSEKDKVLAVSFLKKIYGLFIKEQKKFFLPIIFMNSGAFSYGGTLVPYKALLEVDPPLEDFFLYYDDTEYFWRIKEKGYKSYQVYCPIIEELDQTFSPDLNFLTSFDKKASEAKTYFRARNQHAIALITNSQSKISLFINGVLVISVKIFYAFLKLGINTFTLRRSKLLFLGFWDGINLKFYTKIALFLRK